MDAPLDQQRANPSTVRTLLAKALQARGKPEASGASEAELEAFAAHTGIALPEPLADWLRMADAPSLGSLRLFGIKASQRRRDSDVEELYEIFPEWKARAWIPVGGDGCGNYYVMSASQEFGPGWPVFFVEAVLTAEEPAYLVASNIWAFLVLHLEEELCEDYCSAWLFKRSEALKRDPDMLTYSGLSMPWEAD